MRGMRWYGFSLTLLVSGAGCATARAPIPTDIGTVMAEPETFRNQFVELQGRVEDYAPPRGDTVRTWSFTLVNLAGERIPVYTEGRYAEDVAAADRLVHAAVDDRAPIFAIGYLRTGQYGSRRGGPRLDLRQVQYREDLVNLRRRGYYGDPYDYHPRFHFGFGYYHHSHRGHHHRGYRHYSGHHCY